jgi:hypothetical protein
MQLNLPHRGHQGNWTYKEKEITFYLKNKMLLNLCEGEMIMTESLMNN